MLEGLRCSPDGKVLVVVGGDGLISIWDLVREKRADYVLSAGSPPAAAKFLATEVPQIVAVASDGTLQHWILKNTEWQVVSETRIEVASIRHKRGRPAAGIVCSGGNGGACFVWTRDGLIWEWDLTNNTVRQMYKHSSTIEACAFDQERDRIMILDGERALVAVTRIGGRNTEVLKLVLSERWFLSPAGSFVAWSEGKFPQKSLKIWSVKTQETVQVPDETKPGIDTVVFSPDGVTALVASDRAFGFWNLNDNKWTQPVSSTPGRSFAAAFFAGDGKEVVIEDLNVSRLQSRGMTYFDPVSGRQLGRPFPVEQDFVGASPDLSMFFTLGDEGIGIRDWRPGILAWRARKIANRGLSKAERRRFVGSGR
jgi:WD40 repeat protein